ncbi:MAG: tetratricopeptide repeat protein [Polyangia bacterium]
MKPCGWMVAALVSLGISAVRADEPISPLWDDVLFPNQLRCARLLDEARDLARGSDPTHRALAPLTKAERLCPKSFEAAARLGAALFDAGQLPAARRALERARALAPAGEDGDPRLAFRLGFVRATEGDFAGSLAEYRRALAAGHLTSDDRQDRWLIKYDLGDSLMALGRLTEAIAAYRQARAAAPAEPMIHFALAVALDRNEEREAARAELAIYLRLDPEQRAFAGPDYVFVPAADVHYYRALLALGSGRLTGARAELTAFVAALPQGPYVARAREHLAELPPPR